MKKNSDSESPFDAESNGIKFVNIWRDNIFRQYNGHQLLVQKAVEGLGDFDEKIYFSQISTNYLPFDSASNGDSESEIFFKKFSSHEALGLVFEKPFFEV